jgi:hypothetical protein
MISIWAIELPGALTVDTDDLGPAPSELQLKHIFCLSSPLFSPAVLILLRSFRPDQHGFSEPRQPRPRRR